MKLQEFAHAPGERRNDPLIDIVKKFENEKAKLADLRRQSNELLTIGNVKGRTTPQIDPDRMAEAEKLTREMDACKGRMSELEVKIAAIDDIIDRYKIDRPLYRELNSERIRLERTLERSKAKAMATLGQVLQNDIPDLDAAQQHPKFLAAVKEDQARRAKLGPKLETLASCLEELKVVIG